MAGEVIAFTQAAAQPEIETLRAYKSIYALCTVSKGDELKATHYCAVLIGGAAPTWGICDGGRQVRPLRQLARPD